MKKDKVTKNVVAAIIMHEGKFFAAQRSEKDMRYLMYEFPGGKVEQNETNEAALKRELKEELHLDIFNLEYFTTVNYDYDVFFLHMDIYICEVQNPAFTLTVHAGAGYFTKEELSNLKFLGADQIVLKTLQNSIYFK